MGKRFLISTPWEMLKTWWQSQQFWVVKQALFQELKLLSHLSVTIIGPLLLMVMCFLLRRSIQMIDFWYRKLMLMADGFLR
jgi:hypothetical protein